MSQSIGIIAAMPGELKPLTSRWEALPTAGGVKAWRHTSAEGVVCHAVCGGMGKEPATRAFTRLMELASPDKVLSVGWAGSIDPKFAPGNVFYPSQVVDAEEGESYPLHLEGSLLLISTAMVADREEKYRLALAYSGAALVDMEAATVARLSFENRLQFRCIKAVSDGPDDTLPDLNPFITKNGQFATVMFVASVVLRPWYWSALTRFGKNASLAAENLAVAIRKECGIA